MKRQLLAVTLMAALAAIPVRADDSLLYLAGRPADSQMGSDQLRHRLKDFLSRSASVSAPIRRVAPTQDVAALSVGIPVLTEDTTDPRLNVAHPHKDMVPTSSEVQPPPEEILLPPEVLVAALTADALAAPVAVQDAGGPRELLLDRDIAVHVPEEVVLPPEVLVAALTADSFAAPVPMRTDVTAIAPELDLALPAAETAVDRAQVAHFSERERAVVFDAGEDVLTTLGLEPKADSLPPASSSEPGAEDGRILTGASEGFTQVAAAGPVQLVPQQSSGANNVQPAQAGASMPSEPVLQPRSLRKPDRGYTQLAALSTGPAPATQAISIDGRGKPLTIQTGKGRMLRLPDAVDTVFVAQPEIADIQMKSPRLLYLFGRQPGETTIYATTKDDTVVLNQRIQVSHNLDPLNELIRAVHPESVIEVRSLNNTVVLTGLVPDIATAENIFQLAGQVLGENGRVMNRIKVAGINQVNLRVRIAEVRREISKELGFNWDVLRTTGSLAIGFATAGFGSISSAATNVITTEATLGSLDINSVIDALDDEGLISVLAEPNLTAMNGEVANFLAGGEFPIPIAQGDDTISITFKQFGVSLSFSPQVLEKGRINVKVLTEVSQLSDAGSIELSGFSIPSLTTRRAETTVELRSGQSFAIACLLQNTINQSIDEFPGLADLPILGPLFKSESFQRDETELLVVVTPYLVWPTNAQIALPMDGYVPPTDADRFLRQTNRPRVPSNNAAPRDRGGRPGSVGEAGFIVR